MKTLCKRCNKFIEPLDGYYYKKCPICYGSITANSYNWAIYIGILSFVATLICLSLVSASISVTPYASNPANNSVYTNKYLYLNYNFTTNETLKSIIFNPFF